MMAAHFCVSRFFPGAVDVENIDAWKKMSSNVALQINQYWSNTRWLVIIFMLQEKSAMPKVMHSLTIRLYFAHAHPPLRKK